MAECMVCWFLTSTLKLSVTPTGAGRPGKVPDLAAHANGQSIHIEVKAPHAPLPTGTVWCGDNSGLLAQALDVANSEFAKGKQNALILVTDCSNPLLGGRDDLVKAFFGEDVLQIMFNRQTGEPVEERVVFSPKGKFLKHWDEGKPRFTRTSVVVRLRERLVEGDGRREQWIEPRWLSSDNPYCPDEIPSVVWGDCPQLIVDGECHAMDGRAEHHGLTFRTARPARHPQFPRRTEKHPIDERVIPTTEGPENRGESGAPGARVFRAGCSWPFGDADAFGGPVPPLSLHSPKPISFLQQIDEP